MEGEEIERLVHIQPPWMDQFNAWKKVCVSVHSY